ncbi:hypothetical protein Hanom_Chr01g00088461 [Helianthus anomalus]
MALILKHPHNYLCTFEKTNKNTEFHSIIDTLSSSKYKTLLTCDTPIYQDTLRDFWANAEVQEQDKKALGNYLKSKWYLGINNPRNHFRGISDK